MISKLSKLRKGSIISNVLRWIDTFLTKRVLKVKIKNYEIHTKV